MEEIWGQIIPRSYEWGFAVFLLLIANFFQMMVIRTLYNRNTVLGDRMMQVVEKNIAIWTEALHEIKRKNP